MESEQNKEEENVGKPLYRKPAVHPPSLDDLDRLSRDFGLGLNHDDLGEFKALYRKHAVHPPSLDDLDRLSRDFGLGLNHDDLGEFKGFIDTLLKNYDQLDKLVTPSLPVKYPRTSGYQPQPKDNPYNAWYWRCDIQGASDGLLKGKTIGIKDCIAVAGIPMCVGSRILSGHVPHEDATVVTRILDAGGRILGKTSTENFCMGTSSWANDLGPILNPYDITRSTGGSSGGSAVAVLCGDVDMTLGTDQGGSIRNPASWCGLVGLKPTWGLVPYTGIGQLEVTVDHVGPITRTVADCALMLEAIAGFDAGYDPRQHPGLTVPKYSQLLNADVRGIKIGLLSEGFQNATSEVQKVVREAVEWLTGVGAHVREVSIPMHKQGVIIGQPILMEGIFKNMIEGAGQGCHYKGRYSEGLITKIRDGFKTRAQHGSEPLKLRFLLGGYMAQTYGNEFYAKAQNLVPKLTEAYDMVLQEYDVIVMPTNPCLAIKLPEEGASITERLKNSFGKSNNLTPFNITGHPALSINAGFFEGLPVGMMIVGQRFDDVNVLNVAYAFERTRDEKLSTKENISS